MVKEDGEDDDQGSDPVGGGGGGIGDGRRKVEGPR